MLSLIMPTILLSTKAWLFCNATTTEKFHHAANCGNIVRSSSGHGAGR